MKYAFCKKKNEMKRNPVLGHPLHHNILFAFDQLALYCPWYAFDEFYFVLLLQLMTCSLEKYTVILTLGD